MVVYLGGPMEGITLEESRGWRETATFFLNQRGITVLDPTRRKRFHDQPHSTNLSKKIVAMDLRDVKRADILLLNLKDRGAGKAWGSLCELMYAYEHGKVIITVLEEGFYHPFVEALSTEQYSTLDSALESILGYYA